MSNEHITRSLADDNTIKRSKVPKEQTIFRNASPTVGYTPISNALLQCKGLSPDVIGFIAALLSFPRDWSFNYEWAEAQFGIGEWKLLRIIRDAKAAGFMKVEKLRDAKGIYTGDTVYSFTDTPNTFADDAPNDASITVVSPATGKTQPRGKPSAGETTAHTKEKQKAEKKDSLAHPADGARYSALEKGNGDEPAKPEKSAYPEGFEAFWAAYPKKRGKAKAAERWGKMSTQQRLEAVAAIAVYLTDKKARDGFVQQADTYLTKRTWEDYPPAECAGDPDAALWTGRLKRYAENRTWPIRGQWGPPPGAPGCVVPKPIIDRYFETGANGGLKWRGTA